MRVLGTIVIAFLLGACGQPTEITAFHTLSRNLAGQSFEMAPVESQQSSLEWQTYANLVASNLEAKGLRRVGAQQGADYAVFVHYMVGSGRTSVSAMPIYGQTSAGTTTTTTSYVGGWPIQQASYKPPTYGVTGYYPVSSTTFGKTLQVSMMDLKKSVAERTPVTAYEATVITVGSSSSLNRAIPAMVTAAFQDWPGKSGVTRRIEIPKE